MGTKTNFENALARVFAQISEPGVPLQQIKRLSGGASQETWLLSGGDQNIILRRAPGGGSAARNSTAIGLPAEAALIKAAGKAGVPVPKILYILTPEDGLGDGFFMQYVPGETIARKILRDPEFVDARAGLATQCGTALAHIHALPVKALPESLTISTGAEQISQYEAIFRDFDVNRPVFELALQWLKLNAPEPLTPVLVHGDFRLGNLMVEQRGLAAVLDWELAHIGDPREDLAWICVNSWRFGARQNRVGGFGQIEELLMAYQAAGGLPIAPQDIDWWEMLGTLKWGIMCMIMYEAFRSGADPSVERAAIGRRVSETEIDLILLLEAAHARST